MSYGADIIDSFRLSGAYVDKVLKGAKPADLPVEQPTKFELFINLKTTKTLGLSVPRRSLPALPRLFNRSRGALVLAATISLHRLHASDWRHPRSSWAGGAAEER